MKIRKRVIISLLLTITIAILTNKYWLIFRPMPISFDIIGKGKCGVEVLLNKKDNDNFNKVRSGYVDIDLDKTNHIDLLIDRARNPKRVRLEITDIQSTEKIHLSNIKIRKFNLDSLDKFEVKGATTDIEKNELILYPNNNKITLTHPETLNIRSAIKFDFKIFVIIIVLTYLLAYKLTNYIADFKTIENKSRIEIIFLSIFFIFLFIPMSHISQEEISKQENRYLAKWQPIVNENGELNFDFGKNFNDWFNDRFCLRKNFINFNNSIKILFTSKCEKGFLDKNTYTTYPNWSFGHHDIELIKDNFKALYQFNDYCKKNNIKLYTLIVPQKADVHPTKYNFIQDDYKHDAFLNYVKELQQENKIKIIYPYEKIREEAQAGKIMYFKTEHHWTDEGAFVGYQELMKSINKDYPDIKVLTKNDFNIFSDKKIRGDFGRYFGYGQDCWRMGISEIICKKYHNFDYNYFKHKDFENLDENIINIEYHYGKLYQYNKGANHRIIQLGTSQNENLTEFIPFTFKAVKRLRNNNVKGIKFEDEFKIIKYYQEEILEYNPEIIIFCITYGNIKELHNLFTME